MEFESSFCFIFFSFAFSFFFFSFLLFFARLRPCCDCDVCKTYVKRSWSLEFSNLIDWYSHLLRKSPTGTIHIHVLGNVVTANPDNVEYILKTNFDNYPKGKPFAMILGDLLGRGIFNVDGDSWKFQRKMASLELGNLSVRATAFNIVESEIQSRLIPLLSSVADQEDRVLDMQDVLRRFSFDSICRFSFGVDPGCLNLSLPDSDFAVAFDLASKLCAERAMTPSPWIWKMKKLFNVGSEKQLKEAINVINVLAEKMIRTRREMGEFSAQNDLLSRFMANISDDKYLRDIIISFLLAGRDTVASALTSFFWLLTQHPEVESKIREESDRVMGRTLEPVSFEQTRDMHYLQAALHESMRLYPPVQFDSKFSQDDDVLPDGTFITKGTRVTYNPYAMGRMERIWGFDCLEFKPERWLQNGMFKQENPFKYPVFQAGLRVCLGKELSLVEMKSVAISLIRKFDIRVVAPSQPLRFVPGLTATVSGGLPVTIRERRN